MAGTVLVRDIFPGLSGSYPTALTNIAGRLYFSANNGVVGDELWSSNGTFNGTVLESDIQPGAGSSAPNTIVSLLGRIVLTAVGTGIGREFFSEAPPSLVGNSIDETQSMKAEGESNHDAALASLSIDEYWKSRRLTMTRGCLV